MNVLQVARKWAATEAAPTEDEAPVESLLTAAVEKLKARDPDSMRTWVQENYGDVYRFMLHLTRHKETAEDLAQQTFMHAIEGLRGYEGRSSMRTWLHSIAFREYTRWRRRNKLMFPLELLGLKAEPDFERFEDGQAILAALHRLPSAQREVFLLFEVQRLSIDEICVATGSPEGTIKARLHHARMRLRQLLLNTFSEVSK